MVFFLCCRNWSLLSFKKYICEVLGVVLKQLGAIKSIRSPRVYTVEDYYRDQKGTFSELLRPSVDLIHRQMSSSHFILWRQEHLKRFSREGTGNFVDKVKEDYCRNKYIVLGFVCFFSCLRTESLYKGCWGSLLLLWLFAPWSFMLQES